MHQAERSPNPSPWLFAALVFLATTSVTLVLLLLGGHLSPQAEPDGDDPLALHRPRERGAPFRFTSDEARDVLLFRRAAPSVVHVDAVGGSIKVRRADRLPDGIGSGFVWSDRGYIVTSLHVVDGRGGKTSVTLADGSKWPAKFVGENQDYDLAVLAIDAPSELLHPIELGRSEDLAVGQRVYAIGNPFGLDHTLTVGVVSGLDRNISLPSTTEIAGTIQTDAAINPGNSGGPLLNSAGQLIGINVALHSASAASAGVGFAIPVDVINSLVPEILSQGMESWPELGFVLAPDGLSRQLLDASRWTEHTGRDFGVVVIEVSEGLPAGLAGIRPTLHRSATDIVVGDVIVAVDGLSLSTRDEFTRHMAGKGPGDRIRLELRRDGKPLDQELVLAQR